MKRQVAMYLWLGIGPVFAETGAVPVGRVEPYLGGIRDYASLAAPQETVTVAGATFLRLHFRDFHLAPGDALAVSAAKGGRARRYYGRGPSGTGTFWSFSIPGDTARLVIETAGAAGPGHGYRIDKVVRGDAASVSGGAGDVGILSVCGDDGTEDVACHLDEVGAAQRPVARLSYVSGGGSFVCTGWLVRGAETSTLMTNNHCIASQAEADTVEARFNYQMESCGGSVLTADVRYLGGTLLRTHAGLDYTLMTVHGDPAAAWGQLVASSRPLTGGEPIWLVQHPVGQPKKIGYWEDAAKTQRCDVEAVGLTAPGYDPETQIGYSCDSRGGSSGAPLILAGTNEVVGLHHIGGCFNHATHMTAICADAGALLSCDAGPSIPTPAPTEPPPSPTPTTKPAPTPTPTETPSPTPTPTVTPTATPTPLVYVNVTPDGSNVTATGDDGHAPCNTVDDLLSTRWSAWGSGQRLRFDLGAPRRVGHVTIAVYRGHERRNQFYLQLSSDGAAWRTVFYGHSSGTTTLGETYDFADEEARYVRYVGQGAALNAGGTTGWNSLTEVDIFAAP